MDDLPDIRVETSHDGFRVVDRKQSDYCVVRWCDVQKIRTYKRDLGTVDEICLLFETASVHFEIWESIGGYERVVKAMESRFPIPADWWWKVAFPAFETNEAVLCQRASAE